MSYFISKEQSTSVGCLFFIFHEVLEWDFNQLNLQLLAVGEGNTVPIVSKIFLEFCFSSQDCMLVCSDSEIHILHYLSRVSESGIEPRVYTFLTEPEPTWLKNIVVVSSSVNVIQATLIYWLLKSSSLSFCSQDQWLKYFVILCVWSFSLFLLESIFRSNFNCRRLGRF